MINYDALSENENVKYIFTGDAMHGKYAKTYFWTVNVNLP